MKKKIITVICCGVVLVTSITTLCSGNVQTFFVQEGTDVTDTMCEDVFDFEFSPKLSENAVEELNFEAEEIISDVFSVANTEEIFTDIYSIIEENELDKAEENQIKVDLISAVLSYGATQEELNHIKDLFEKGYDMDKVLEVYEFIRWTDCDYSALADILEAGIENSDQENWIYDAYDKYFNRTDDMLLVEDVAYYVANGISVEEIVGAYELSFAGEKNTKQMLKERMDGKTWNEISATSLSENPKTVLSAPEMTIEEIMKFRGVCVRQRKNFEEIADIHNERNVLKDEARITENTRKKNADRLMKKYKLDADTPKPKYEHRANYAETMPQPLNIEEEFEEDLIPVDEPEVE